MEPHNNSQEEAHSSENDPASNEAALPSESESAESEQQSVELLSRLEEGLDAIEGLKNEIEQRGEAKLEELRDPALSAKHQKILEALEKENESFLKKMSSA